MVLQALGAGQDRVVVGHHDRAVSVHGADPGYEAVRWGAGHQIFDRPAPALGSDGQRAVLDVAAGIAQVLDVLARSALIGVAPAGDSVRPPLVSRHGVPLDNLGQVAPLLVRSGDD